MRKAALRKAVKYLMQEFPWEASLSTQQLTQAVGYITPIDSSAADGWVRTQRLWLAKLILTLGKSGGQYNLCLLMSVLQVP